MTIHFDGDDTFRSTALCGATGGMQTVNESRVTCEKCKHVIATINAELDEENN